MDAASMTILQELQELIDKYNNGHTVIDVIFVTESAYNRCYRLFKNGEYSLIYTIRKSIRSRESDSFVDRDVPVFIVPGDINDKPFRLGIHEEDLGYPWWR